MATCKVISGLTASTAQNLVLDAGAFFKNYNFIAPTSGQADTFDTAVKAGKLLGATKGGGSFKAVPKFRTIEIDGKRGDAKGDKILESWEITLGASIIEIKADTIKDALGVATVSTVSTPTGYKKITGKTCIKGEDYIENITWVGNLSGSDNPVVIQIFNALNTKGIEFKFEDKSELVIDTEFMAHFDMATPNTVPFAIYFPDVAKQ